MLTASTILLMHNKRNVQKYASTIIIKLKVA